MLCSVFDFGDCCFDICLLCCLHLFLFVCSVFPDKFHVQLLCDRIMDLRNDICMYVHRHCVIVYMIQKYYIVETRIFLYLLVYIISGPCTK